MWHQKNTTVRSSVLNMGRKICLPGWKRKDSCLCKDQAEPWWVSFHWRPCARKRGNFGSGAAAEAAWSQKCHAEMPITSFGSSCRRKLHCLQFSDSLRALSLDRKGWWICFILCQHLPSAWLGIAKDQKENFEILWSNSGSTVCYHSKNINQ